MSKNFKIGNTTCVINTESYFYPHDVERVSTQSNLMMGVMAAGEGILAIASIYTGYNAYNYAYNHDITGAVINGVIAGTTGYLAGISFIANNGVMPASETFLHLVDGIHFLGDVGYCKLIEAINPTDDVI